jgi:hypothetical protein
MEKNMEERDLGLIRGIHFPGICMESEENQELIASLWAKI